MTGKYRLGFSIWALLLFLAVMIPNFIWFAVPAPNDVLRADSVTGGIDAAASVCQVLAVVTLCIFVNTKSRKFRVSPLIIAAAVCCLSYFAAWICYYTGMVNTVIILGLTILPCLAFMLFAIDRKNLIALVPISIFSVCHLIYAAVNFII